MRGLERGLAVVGEEATRERRRCLAALESARLETDREVYRLHEVLCFLRAYPDDAEGLELVERMLESFHRRPDLRRFRRELADSGIAGTDIHFPFFHPQASWLARRHGPALHVDWKAFEGAERLRGWLETAMLESEVPALYDAGGSVETWVERMKRDDQTDGQFVVRQLEDLTRDARMRRGIHDTLEIPYCIDGREGGPSRTRGHYPDSPTVYRTEPLDRSRPALDAAVRRKPLAVRHVSPAEGRALIDLANEAMVTRSRDLDSFSYGNEEDVRMVELGDGLQLACIGLVPEQRIVLEGLYAFLILQNGVPSGYTMCSALFRSSDVAYNVFETFRGAEAARVYGKILGAVCALFGSDALCVTPYQLGHRNEEGLASGAWWFYQKLGFRARDPEVLALMEAELAAMRRDPSHRTGRRILKQLSAKYVFWYRGRPREDVIGVIPLERISLGVAEYVGKRFGSSRRRARRVMSEEAAARVGARGWRDWSPGERGAWERWSPLLLQLTGLERWSAKQRHELVRVVRAKGGRSESDYLERFERHQPLKTALLRYGAAMR